MTVNIIYPIHKLVCVKCYTYSDVIFNRQGNSRLMNNKQNNPITKIVMLYIKDSLFSFFLSNN